MFRNTLYSLLVVALLAVPSVAGQTYSLDESSTIEVAGASNKSDWTVGAPVFTGSVTLEEGAPTAAELTVSAGEMKSGRSLIMDRLMYGALKVDEHPDITFVMTEATLTEENNWLVSGDLTLSGSTNPIEIQLLQSMSDGGIVFDGAHELNMRDYEIKPPTAMFGALITKPDVTLTFHLVLSE